MLSWLNFEELLIHNPIQLVNPSEDVISVAMNKKQYIEFFSNKYTYNGLYYDEAMDFCLFYYADPLQSSKNGDMYAEGYIDVDMKIYRVKMLCNVSISRPFAPDTTNNLLDVKDGAGFSDTGNGQSNQGHGFFHFNEWKLIPELFKAGDVITITCEVAFFDTELYGDSDAVHIRFQLVNGNWQQLFKVDVKTVNGKFYTREAFKTSEWTENPSHIVKVSQTMKIEDWFITQNADVNQVYFIFDWIPNGARISVDNLKIELNGSEQKHTAYAYSSDGKDGFSTIYPNLNLLDGTKDFSGTWEHSWDWETDGTYKGLVVKKRAWTWNGIRKTFTAPKDGVYTFSAYVKSSGGSAIVQRYISKNNVESWSADLGNNFDWLRDTLTVALKAGDNFSVRYELNGLDSILWTCGHKWEQGSIATPYMPSASEVTPSDYPTYIGTYTDYMTEDSPYPESYTWNKIQNKWNVSKTEMVVNATNKTIATVLNGALSKCTKNKDITGWYNNQPNENYNYRQPTYTLDITGDDFIISGYGLRGLKNG
jgi:hypothetical protein|nr:MAG TPA_asm: Minor structural protein 4 [Caudoviricetes sp.]